MVFFKIFIVVFLTFLILGIAGEIYLRDFSFYGIEHFIQLEEKKIKKDMEAELNFMPNSVLDALSKAIEDPSQEGGKNNPVLYRIIILGDSVAAGGGLKQDDLRFSERIKEALQQNYPNINFNVLVCAAGGWSTSQEVVAYEKYCQDIRHDLAILAYCQNDDAEFYQRIRKKDGRLILTFYKTGVPCLTAIPFNQFFAERLLIIRFINEYSIKLLQYCHIPFYVNYCLVRDDKVFGAFKKLQTLTRLKRIPVLVVVFPHLIESMGMHDIRMSGLIQKWCKELNWGYLNLQELYNSYGLKALRAKSGKDVIHPNNLGHKIAAEAIMEELKQIIRVNGY